MIFVIGIRLGPGGGERVFNQWSRVFHDVDSVRMISTWDDLLKFSNFSARLKFVLRLPLVPELFFDAIFHFNPDDVIINLGDVPFKTKRKQIYHFDWSYLFLDYKEIVYRGFNRLGKKFVIENLLIYTDIIVTQTLMVSQEFMTRFNKETVTFIIHKDFEKIVPVNQFTNNHLIYPASGSNHKRHDRLIVFAKQNPSYEILVTLPTEDFENIYRNAPKNIVNIGWQTPLSLHDYYLSVKGIIYPSELESLGLPLIEALVYSLPVVYWGQDFVKEVIENPILYSSVAPEMVMNCSIMNSNLVIVNSPKEILKLLDL